MSWRILDTLTPAEIQREIALHDFPKWTSLCLLRQGNMPALQACCIRPDASGLEVEEALTQFTAHIQSTRVLVRSDGGREHAHYYVGGDTFADSAALSVAQSLLQQGRAVIFLEPTDRLRNRLAASIRLDRGCQEGQLIIELLGPGFDVGDLARGGMTPSASIVWHGVSWSTYARPRWSDLDVWYEHRRAALDANREARVRRIGQRILPAAGLTARALDTRETEEWLNARGYTHVWRPIDGRLVASNLYRWIDDAQLIASIHPNRGWVALCLTFSDLGDGRSIYWDVVDAHEKYALSSRAGR